MNPDSVSYFGSSVFDGKSAEWLKVKGMSIPFTFNHSGFHLVNPGRTKRQ